LGLTDDSSPPRPPALLRQRVQPLHQGGERGDRLPGRRNIKATWDNLQFGLRLGRKPRQVITTTPKPIALLRELVKRAGQDVVITRGTTYDNRANLAESFFSQMPVNASQLGCQLSWPPRCAARRRCSVRPARLSSADARRRQAHPRRPVRPRRGARLALRYQGRKRVHYAEEIMAEIVAPDGLWSTWSAPDSW
jgi:hypothetical protein